MRTHRVTVEELLEVLSSRGMLTENQAKNTLVRAETQRARLKISRDKNNKTKGDKTEITAAEIIASMQFKTGDGPDAMELDEDTVVKILAEHMGVPYEKIDALKLDSALITSTVPLPFARRASFLPLRKNGNELQVAVTDPFDVRLFDELRRVTRYEIKPVLTSRTDIQRFITEVYGFKRSVTSAANEMSPIIDLGNLEQLVLLGSVDEIEANDQHVVNAVDYILHYAFDQRASDIHIEPKREFCRVRMRIDGVLHDIYKIPRQVHPAIVSRIKTLSRLDLAERRRPQDGRFKTNKDGIEVEMRVSTLPVAFGEKMVIRIFDPTVLIQDIEALGFEWEGYRRYLEFIERPNGLVLVTGPTGSGKTTTLYSTLKHLASPQVNITSIEDPIEMVFEDFNQIAVQPKIGITFAHALRHILRQDPDIIMVGEIRDTETAQQAIQAALTGHLVISTLHTNDSASSITRLIELGLNPYLISSTLVGVVAQRLVRKICSKCKSETVLSIEQRNLLKIDIPDNSDLPVWHGTGCVHCRNTGLYGRSAIFEMLTVNDGMRDLINERADAAEIMRAARADGTVTLREAAIRKLAEGVTSFDEIIRLTIGENER